MMGDLLILVVARVGATSRWHLADGGGVVDGIAEVVLCFAKWPRLSLCCFRAATIRAERSIFTRSMTTLKSKRKMKGCNGKKKMKGCARSGKRKR
jgi:hypothetical protein